MHILSSFFFSWIYININVIVSDDINILRKWLLSQILGKDRVNLTPREWTDNQSKVIVNILKYIIGCP